MSLFGNLNASKPQTPSLFGTANTQAPTLTLTGATPVGSSSTNQSQTRGLFGSAASKPGGLFGNTTTSQPAQTGGLFGSTATSQPQTGGLFGGGAASQPQTGGLFGASTTNQPKTGGLFGSSLGQAQQQPQQGAGSGMFSGLGGQQQQQTQQGGGLFAGLGQQQQQQQQPAQTPSLFGQPQQPQQQLGTSLFGQPAQQQQQSQTGLGGSMFSQLGQGQQNTQQQSFGRSLWTPGSTITPRERTVPETMQTLLEKWNPESVNCSFQHYFYNNVPPEHVPYYSVPPGEDETKWEEALSKKPSPGSIPVLGKGFYALGHRLQTQVQAVIALQQRLHEINNSLTAMMQNHDLVISVRIQDARRKHIALSQRCLSLATKTQILKLRGYGLQPPEETLKAKLLELERGVFDPRFTGREEEIWARMLALRQRTKFIQDEMDKIGKNGGNGEDAGLDEEVMKSARKILGDYASQLAHLDKELKSLQSDYVEWENTTKLTSAGR